MSESDFYQPQQQSKAGILLIFATSLVHILRNLWVVGVYFLIGDINVQVLFMTLFAAAVVLLAAFIYSVLYYLKFIFYIDEKNQEFVLQKGVFASNVVNIPFSKIQQVNFKRSLLQRAIGVYSVVIDTAGSGDSEVEIKALSRDKANILAEMLMDLSGKHVREREETVEEEKESRLQWEYKVEMLTLLKLGLTSNYFRGLAILIAFYFTLREQFMLEEVLPAEIPISATGEFAATAFMFLFLLLVGLVITVAETFIKYFNLHLKKTPAGLQVEMGLRTNTKVSLKSSRVQLVQVLTNPLQQRLNLFKLKISLASSLDDLEKSQITVPGLTKDVVSQVQKYFYTAEVTEEYDILPHRILLFRKILRGLIPLALGLIFILMNPVNWSPVWIGGVVALYLIVLSVFQYFYFRSIRLSVSEKFLIKHSGVWRKKTQFLEMYKLQSVSVSQPIWYKKRGLVNLTFHSAGGDIAYPLVRIKDVIALVDYVVYRIESTSRPWM